MRSIVDSQTRQISDKSLSIAAWPEISSQQVVSEALVSVVIPCYNQAHFLPEAVASVLVQSHLNFELIVVDDGSTDNTAQVSVHYPGIKYVYQPNQGLAAARNTGLRHSSGDFLIFLDADDRLLPDALQNGLASMRLHPQCAFVFGHYRFISEDGAPLPSWREQRAGTVSGFTSGPYQQIGPNGEQLNSWPQARVSSSYYTALLQRNYIVMHATVMYRRSALHAVGGFNPELPAAEDYDLYLRLTHRFPVVCHDGVVAEYRLHRSNMTRKSDLMLKATTGVLRSQWPHVAGNSHYEQAYQRGMQFWQAYYSQEALKEIPLHLVGGRWQHAGRAATVGWNYLWGRTGRAIKGIWALVRYRIGQGWRRITRLPVNRLKWGDLRQLNPLGQNHTGQNRGRIPGYYIQRFLDQNRQDVSGRVLLLHYGSVKLQLGRQDCQLVEIVLDPVQQPLLDDLEELPSLPNGQFDCIIMPQLLQRVYHLPATVQAVYRLLKPGGVLLLTVPGFNQKPGGVLLLTVPGFNQNQRIDQSYWAFTDKLVGRLLATGFAPDSFSVEVWGNVLAATAHLHRLPANTLSEAQLEHRDAHYQLMVGARAVKAIDQKEGN
jgi:glycosyltransferase involved in cell wall biosynthesis